MVCCRTSKLGHRAAGISFSSAREPNRLPGDDACSTQNFAGSDHPVGLLSIRCALHEPTSETRLSVVGALLVWRGVFHVSLMTVNGSATRNFFGDNNRSGQETAQNYK